MNHCSTTVRMLHTGLVLRDNIRSDRLDALRSRHDQLVSEMTGMVRGTQTQIREHGRLFSTIFVGNKALIEVMTS